LEIDIVNQFRQSAAKTEVIGERAADRSFALPARPIQIKDPACLTCHRPRRRAADDGRDLRIG
jgi:hypothetical protein